TKVSTTASATATPTGGISGYAKPNGKVFTINGTATHFMGTNSYYIGFLNNNADIDLIMSHVQATGLKVLRLWGFNDVTSLPSGDTVWYQSFIKGQDPVINTGANGLQRLDYVVKSAEEHGISLIINFVNNWSDFGGMPAYASYYGISVTQWYTSTAAQTQYRKYIAAVVARYKTSTAVFAWELANEPRCTFCSTSVITNWVAATSAYIKSLDSNHMVCIGDEGFGLNGGWDITWPYWGITGLSFKNNLAISTIDFGTYHAYPGSWFELDAWVPSWIRSHATAAAALGKPVILEEYGTKSAKSAMVSWQTAVLDTQTAGDMYWQYGDSLSYGLTHDDGHTIYYGSADYATLV
ncbi:glycoside hydrolase superfamily, partial [Rhexocercosporidium sp. MPI-PUGE-AT-0058]